MRFENKNILLSRDKSKNIIENDKKTYEIVSYYLDQKDIDKKGSKGGNSCVFRAIDGEDQKEYIIKFSKFPRESYYSQENNRFQHEIDALNQAKDQGFLNVIEIMFDGIKPIGNKNFMYYVMEKGESDLTSYIMSNQFPLNQKYLLIYEIIKGINQLHSMKLYHRDIKPDNIFFVGNTWKIGDLGLSEWQGKSLDRPGEKIGPFGWLSPEVMNKFLSEKNALSGNHDCNIDEYSDIFQLGKIIWYILNGNVPIGQIKLTDFIAQIRNNKQDIFNLMYKMLQYKKSARGNLPFYEGEFESYAN
ncbi:protein kinase family protein [Fibrella sp. USSR17]